ncbi:MAG: YdcF family protein, partial [Odoribacter sp.]|nr:YdcF family protein [Odoribacter sp.]
NRNRMKKIILLLGGVNDEKGILNKMTLNRADCALTIYHYNEDVSFLCTGGFGEHFNTTQHPHAYYVQKYLEEKGVKQKDFLPPVCSANTVEDFRLAKSVIEHYSPELLLVITSDFHMERVKVLHHLLLDYPKTLFIAAHSSLTEDEIKTRLLHEQKALQTLKDNQYKLF